MPGSFRRGRPIASRKPLVRDPGGGEPWVGRAARLEYAAEGGRRTSRIARRFLFSAPLRQAATAPGSVGSASASQVVRDLAHLFLEVLVTEAAVVPEAVHRATYGDFPSMTRAPVALSTLRSSACARTAPGLRRTRRCSRPRPRPASPVGRFGRATDVRASRPRSSVRRG